MRGDAAEGSRFGGPFRPNPALSDHNLNRRYALLSFCSQRNRHGTGKATPKKGPAKLRKLTPRGLKVVHTSHIPFK